MDTNKILLILGVILLLFFIMRNVKFDSSSTATATKTSTVIYKKPYNTRVAPHYNSYKAQYYN